MEPHINKKMIALNTCANPHAPTGNDMKCKSVNTVISNSINVESLLRFVPVYNEKMNIEILENFKF